VTCDATRYDPEGSASRRVEMTASGLSSSLRKCSTATSISATGLVKSSTDRVTGELRMSSGDLRSAWM
jgi:hypothetical protein